MRWRPIAALALALSTAACSRADPARAGADRVTSPAAIARGSAAFAEHCALCHGEAADGRGRRHLAFIRPPRDFTDAAWREAVQPPEVFAKIRDGVPGTAMPAWRSLGDDTIWDLTAFVLSVGKRH